MTPLVNSITDQPVLVDHMNLSLSRIGQMSDWSFAKSVYSRMEALRSATHLRLKGKNAGDAFELVIADSLIKHGVRASRIVRNVKADAADADADILILPERGKHKAIIIMAKTSLRERWKQEDRDGLCFMQNIHNCWGDVCNQHGLLVRYSPDVWAVMFREDADWTVERNLRMAYDKGGKSASIASDQFICAYDEDGMDRMLRACL
jgi:hypothetical protein